MEGEDISACKFFCMPHLAICFEIGWDNVHSPDPARSAKHTLGEKPKFARDSQSKQPSLFSLVYGQQFPKSC